MSKIEQIRSEMVAAMKAKDKERKDALSMLLGSLKNKAIDKRSDLTEAEENDIYLVERHFGSKLQVCFAIETFVYIGNTIACIAFAICENYLCFRMI